MKKNTLLLFCLVAILVFNGCTGGSSKPEPEKRNYENSYSSSSIETETGEDLPYLDNSLSTGEQPYECSSLRGDDSYIGVKTSYNSECDVVVIVKCRNVIVRNAYIRAGDSYRFNLPNGYYQVFFYGGRGWNPNKTMPNGQAGGFVANESYSKDEAIDLNYQGLDYELIPQHNGNFSTEQSNASEIF